MNTGAEYERIRIELGARIRMLREKQGMTQRVFAEMIGMDRTYLIAVEYGKRNISIDNLYKISIGLDISLSDLFKDIV